jgi:hypothetical protein
VLNQSIKVIGKKNGSKRPFFTVSDFFSNENGENRVFFSHYASFTTSKRSIKLCFKRIITINIHNPLGLNTFKQCSDIFTNENKCFISFYRLNQKKKKKKFLIFFKVVPRLHVRVFPCFRLLFGV